MSNSKVITDADFEQIQRYALRHNALLGPLSAEARSVAAAMISTARFNRRGSIAVELSLADKPVAIGETTEDAASPVS